MTQSTASSKRSGICGVESFDKEAPSSPETVNTSTNDHIVHVTDQHNSPVAVTGPRMPVAIMVCPEKSSSPSLRARGTSETSSSLKPILITETSQTATLSSTTEWGDFELMDARPDCPDTVAYQEVEDSLEFATEDAFSRQPSVTSSDADKPSPAVSVKESRCRPAPDSSSGLGAAPPALTITGESKHPLPVASIDCASTEPPGAVIPSAIVSENLPPQSLAAPAVFDDVEKAPTENPVPITDVRNILLSPTLSPTAEPYFEYTIHQTISFSQSSTITTELPASPFTVLDNANAQIDKVFRSTTQQYELLGMLCRSSAFKVLDNGLSTREATFTSIEDISKSLTLKLWIERAQVSVYANRTLSPTSIVPLISKTLYALRLWQLAEQAESDSDSDPEVEEDQADEQRRVGKERIRFYHPLPCICTEVHTSLESANHAAKRVQIWLSHEDAPKSMQAKCQRDDLEKLNKKLEDLRIEAEEGDDESGGPSLFDYEEGRRRGYWRSIFTGVGPQRFDIELLVTSVGVSGPMNI